MKRLLLLAAVAAVFVAMAAISAPALAKTGNCQVTGVGGVCAGGSGSSGGGIGGSSPVVFSEGIGFLAGESGGAGGGGGRSCIIFYGGGNDPNCLHL